MKEEIPSVRSDNATIMFRLSFSLEPLSLGETRDPALSKHSRKAHIKKKNHDSRISKSCSSRKTALRGAS